MAGPRVVGMPVRDQGAIYRTRRIDMEGARRAEEPGRRREKEVFGAHRPITVGFIARSDKVIDDDAAGG